MSNGSSGISTLKKLLYASGNLGYTGWFQLLSGFLLFFLVDVVFLNSWLAAIIFAFSFGFLNALTDPIVGNLSDRTRSRLGRRRPWIIIGAPFCLLITIFIWWIPPLGGQPLADPNNPWIFVYMLVIVGIAELAWTMCAIPYFALFPEMFSNLKERSEVSIYRQILGVVGGIMAMAVFPLLVTFLSGAPPLEITTISLADGMNGKAYSRILKAEGGTSPYIWQIRGNLPEGLYLSGDGEIAGTPAKEGVSRFTVSVIDRKSKGESHELEMNIRAPGDYGISSKDLTDGRVEKDYREKLYAIMEMPPVTWSLASGILPDGLSLSSDGMLSGSPSTAGDFIFAVKATDTAGNIDTRELNINVGSKILVSGTFQGWAWGGGIIVGVFMVTYLITGLWGSRERRGFSLVDKPLGFVESLKKAITNTSLIAYSGAHVMTYAMVSWLSAMLPFFAVHVLGEPVSAVAVVFGANLAGILISFPIWRKMCLRYGARKIIIASLSGFTLTMMLALVVNNVPMLSLMGFLAGASISGTLIARDIIFADIIDEDELKTGVKREGVLVGTLRMVEKLSLVITASCTGLLLSTIIGYVPGEIKPSFMEMGIRAGMSGFTAVFFIVALVFLKFYPLTKQKTDITSEQLEKMHVEKAEQLTKSHEEVRR